MRSKIKALLKLNKTLSPPPQERSGLFLPIGSDKRYDVLLLAEMPSMNKTKDKNFSAHNFHATERDSFFRKMLVKYGLSGVYVTDIVKRRATPRKPTKHEIEKWLPFLKKEIAILNPSIVIAIGWRTYESFLLYVNPYLDSVFHHDFIYHYCSRVTRAKFESRLRDVVAKYHLSRQ